jgi:hypothetical protein
MSKENKRSSFFSDVDRRTWFDVPSSPTGGSIIVDKEHRESSRAVDAARLDVQPESPTQKLVSLRNTLAAQLGTYEQQKNKQSGQRWDRSFVATILVACVTSISATVFVFKHHWILAYGDAYSHMEIGRRLLDSITPGVGQLGGVWLPLPHVLIALFAWNDYLWQTGLGGSFVGMGCYITTAIYLFLAARRLTSNSTAAFIGTLVYILNPNVLYLQATPLTEPVCQVTFTMACYYMLAWGQEDSRKYLVLAAASTFLATIARYDGWILVPLFPIIIILTGILKKHSLQKIEGNLIIFLALGSLGIILWLLWGQIIFGDPLYFQHGPFSAQQQTMLTTTFQRVERGHLLNDIWIYTVDSLQTIGTGMFVLALIAILFFLYKRWKAPDTLAILAFLAPFPFYIAALFGGQIPIFNAHIPFYPSGMIPFSEGLNLFNARYGSEMVAPAAIFIATLVPIRSPTSTSLQRKLIPPGRVILLAAVILQSCWLAYGGTVSLISDINPPFCVRNYPISVYLEEHYNGGRILQGTALYLISESESDIDFKNVVYEGSGALWTESLQYPELHVSWIIFGPGDNVSKAMAHDPGFSKDFRLVQVGPTGERLYHRIGQKPLANRPISSYLLNEKDFCAASRYKKLA